MLVASAAIAALLTMRARRQRHMRHTHQSAQMFVSTSPKETREANARVIRHLAEQGLAVPGFTSQVVDSSTLEQVGITPEVLAEVNDRAQVVMGLLRGGGAGLSADVILASSGMKRAELAQVLAHLERQRLVARESRAHTYRLTDEGRTALARLDTNREHQARPKVAGRA